MTPITLVENPQQLAMDDLVGELVGFSQHMTDHTYKWLMDSLQYCYFNESHGLHFNVLEFSDDTTDYSVITDGREVYLTKCYQGQSHPYVDDCYNLDA